VVTVGVSSSARCTFGGFDITFNKLISDLDLTSFDAVAIPGGFEKSGYYKDAFSEPMINALKEFDRTKKRIASICISALPIAKSGALNGRKATTYHLDDGKWRQQLLEFGAEVVDAPVATDSNITTSTSPGTALEVAFSFLENLTSKNNCQHIKKQMGF
jgi:4-methyl-5(b-hydroxyethyl)-thiazole monophosphate biosynthesis